MAEINWSLGQTDPVAQQAQAYNYADKVRQNAAGYQAGAQYAKGDYTGAAQTQAQAGDIPAAQATQQYGQKTAGAGQQYIAQALPVFQKIAEVHANDPDKGAAALGDAFDHIAPEAQALTGATPQALATFRQSLVSDPQNTISRLSAQVPIQDKIVGDTDFRFQGPRLIGSYTGKKTITAPSTDNVLQIGGDDASAAPSGGLQQPGNAAPAAPGGSSPAPATTVTPQSATVGVPPPAPGGPQPLGMRSNNPGNIQPGGQEAVYPTMAEGVLHASNLLDQYAAKGKESVSDIINTWAPQYDQTGKQINNTPAYIQYVAGKLGVDPSQPLNLKDPSVKGKLLDAVFHYENGQNPLAPTGPMPQGVTQQPSGQQQPQQANGVTVLQHGVPPWRAPTDAEKSQYPGATQINSGTGEVKYPPMSALGASLSDAQIQPYVDILKAGGTIPQRIAGNPALYTRVLSAANEQGVSPADFLANQGNRKATQIAFQQVNNRYAMVQSQEDAFQKSLDLATSLVQKAGNQGGGTFINNFRNWVKTGVVGDPATGAAINAVNTAMNEYGKIIEGSTGNAGSSISARDDANHMLSMADNIPAFLAKIPVLKADADFKIGSLKTQHDTLLQTLGSIGQTPPQTPPANDGIQTVSSPAAAMKLAPGTKFRTPDGVLRVRK